MWQTFSQLTQISFKTYRKKKKTMPSSILDLAGKICPTAAYVSHELGSGTGVLSRTSYFVIPAPARKLPHDMYRYIYVLVLGAMYLVHLHAPVKYRYMHTCGVGGKIYGRSMTLETLGTSLEALVSPPLDRRSRRFRRSGLYW